MAGNWGSNAGKRPIQSPPAKATVVQNGPTSDEWTTMRGAFSEGIRREAIEHLEIEASLVTGVKQWEAFTVYVLAEMNDVLENLGMRWQIAPDEDQRQKPFRHQTLQMLPR